jgi:hypothetical protein
MEKNGKSDECRGRPEPIKAEPSLKCPDLESVISEDSAVDLSYKGFSGDHTIDVFNLDHEKLTMIDGDTGCSLS